MDNRVIEGRKMYHLDEKQIQEITDYIFLTRKGRCNLYSRLCQTRTYRGSGKAL